jgi:transposase InsO family protein
MSKWIEVIPVPAADAETTVRTVLLHLIARFGTPAEFICDNGPAFKGVFEDFCNDRRIPIRFITPGMPRSNGLVERAVKTVKRALQNMPPSYIMLYHGAPKGLANILLGYRITPQASTGWSPAHIMFAQNLAFNSDKYASKVDPIDYLEAEDHLERLQTSYCFGPK